MPYSISTVYLNILHESIEKTNSNLKETRQKDALMNDILMFEKLPT